MTLLHVVGNLFLHRGLLEKKGVVSWEFRGGLGVSYVRCSGRPGLESAEDFENVVLGVGRKRVSSCVDSYARSSGNVVVEFDVGCFGLVELHVPVAVRGDVLGEALSEGDLREGGAIRGERTSREGSTI